MIILAMFLLFFAYLYHERRKMKEKELQVDTIMERKRASTIDLDAFIDSARFALDRMQKQYDDALKSGAKPEQLKKQQDDMKYAKMIVDNEAIIRFIGPSAIKFLTKMAKNFTEGLL